MRLLPHPSKPSECLLCAEAQKSFATASILIDDCLVLGINYNSSHFVLRLSMDGHGRKWSKHKGRRRGRASVVHIEALLENNGHCSEAVD